jgi:serine protease AprX
MKRAGLALTAALVLIAVPAWAAPGDHPKLDSTLNSRARNGSGFSRVIVVYQPGADASSDVKRFGGKLGRQLTLIGAQVMELPNGQLKKLADHPGVASIHWDRPISGSLNRVAVTVGARSVQDVLKFTGAGVGVAVIDSGVTSWHDDLTYMGTSPVVRTQAGQRVVDFVDFVNGLPTPYDDNGHGTHVSGVIAGNGYDSRGIRAGIAPGAHLVSLKVLDGNGLGTVGNVIAALGYVVENRAVHNIRVVNLSVGAAVLESYRTDPLTLAAKRAVDAGVVVVAAAGNLGTNAAGQVQYGGITAPGNAPWVLTVGASSHQGTVTRVDDVMALYSSRGPSAIDFQAKPDLVAPGTGVVSLSNPDSLLYTTKSEFLLNGTVSLAYKPYLSLSGTSMAAPVVAGTVALMMEANPQLTPNLVKALLQYTAQAYPSYNALTQGAGFLNARSAVDVANYFATAQPGESYFRTNSRLWSRQIIWGNRRLGGGAISPSANAWSRDVVWGSTRDADGDNIVWGTDCENELCDNIVWGTDESDVYGIEWGAIDSDGIDSDGDNIVWGTFCLDALCDSIEWGTIDSDGTSDGDNIVWGTDCGGDDCDSIVWGTFNIEGDGDNLVWGTYDGLDSVLWIGDCELELCDNIVWGTSNPSGVMWGNSGEELPPLFDDPNGQPAEFDAIAWEELFGGDTSTGGTSEPTAPLSTDTELTTTTSELAEAGGL